MLLASGSAYAQTAVAPPGSGTSADPYRISEIGHLVWMSDTAGNSAGKYYSMTADIDASVTATWNDDGTDTSVLEGFRPIGTSSNPDTTSFRGVFDGNGHTISGLNVNRTTTDKIGLFGTVGSGGSVQNLGLMGGAVMGDWFVGGLVGMNRGNVMRCCATTTIQGTSDTGGLLGINSGTVTDCYATGAVTATTNSVGGLIGFNGGSVSNCYSTGTVSAAQIMVGGLVGYGSSGVSNCYWDTQASGLNISNGGTGRTTAEMKQQSMFAGWDFGTVWGIVEGISYPYLQISPPPFHLDVGPSGPGSVVIDPQSPDGTYAPGAVVTLTASWNAQSVAFEGWLGATPTGSATVTVVMDAHRTVNPVFLPRIDISSLADLAQIGNNPAYPLTNVKYVLTANIDASATAAWNDDSTDATLLEGFRPIGTEFRGVFEGDLHTISGLVINRPTTDNVGLFGAIGSGGTVRNLKLVGGAVTGQTNVGGLVGANRSAAVWNCCTSGSVNGIQTVGGLMGLATGKVFNCYATGTVNGSQYIGGLVGQMLYGTVSNCHATGAVNGGNFVGGLLGYHNQSTTDNCYATGTVAGGNYIGGLVGANYSPLSGCYATGAVAGTSNVGGLVGLNWGGVISDCYSAGAAIGTSQVGGLVGLGKYAPLSNCYAICPVTGQTDTGGLIGSALSAPTSNCYWDTQMSGQSGSAGGTGKTTAEMKQQATFVGWGFADTWRIVEDVTYPYLQTPGDHGDFNRDGHVDADDLTLFGACAAGPTIPYGLGNLLPGCTLMPDGTGHYSPDFDTDGDVDLDDFGVLQRCFSGPVPADPGCNP